MEKILTLQQKIKLACEISETTITELAEKMNTNQPSLSKRIKTGKFTQEELEEIASHLGCKYESSFIFSDGKVIK